MVPVDNDLSRSSISFTCHQQKLSHLSLINIDIAYLITILLLFGIGGTSEKVSEAGGIKV